MILLVLRSDLYSGCYWVTELPLLLLLPPPPLLMLLLLLLSVPVLLVLVPMASSGASGMSMVVPLCLPAGVACK
jgi:hypothetical protein